MKKLLAKITTIVLILAMLIPFTSIPKVEADDTCDGGWEYHTNYYFFLEADNPHTWVTNMANGTGKGFTSHFYTSFLYTFPYDGSQIEFDKENSGAINITNSTDFDTNFTPSYNSTSWTAGQFYYEYTKEGNGADAKYQSFSYSNGASGNSESNNIVTYLYHGPWANMKTINSKIDLNEVGKLSFSDEGVQLTAGGKLTQTEIDNFVNASIILEPQKDATIGDVKIGRGVISSGDEYGIDKIIRAVEKFNSSKGTDEDGAVTSSNNNPVIQLVISRDYTLDDIFDGDRVSTEFSNSLSSLKAVGDGNGGLALSTGSDSINKNLWFPANSAKNESIYKLDSDNTNKTGNPISKQQAYFLKTNYSDTYDEQDRNGTNWFFAPSLYKIAYKVCSTGNSSTTGDSVTVRYDGNAENVSNVPGSWTGDYGSPYTISTQEPTRNGYSFLSWNSTPTCDGKSYDPGAQISSVTNNMTLYACWGSTGAGNQAATGVITYAGIFTGVIALAGGTYYIIKKKNLFKKI